MSLNCHWPVCEKGAYPLILMVALGKRSIKEVKMNQLQKMKKSSILAFYKARTRWLTSEQLQITPQWGHESKEEDQGSVTHGDVKVVKEIIMEQAIVKDS